MSVSGSGRICLRVVLATCALLLSMGARATTLVPTGQERSVSSCAGFADPIAALCSQLPDSQRDFHSETAADFSPFDASVSSTYSDPSVSFGSATSSADQHSEFLASGVEATGSVSTNAAFGAHIADAESLLTLVFQVSVATPYELSGEIGAENDATTLVRLEGPSGILANKILYDEPNTGFPGSGQTFSFSGVLLPGEYTFTARTSSCSDELAQIECGRDYGLGFFDVSFVVPEPSTGLLLAAGLAGLGWKRRAALQT